MTPFRIMILFVFCLSLTGCRDPNPPAIAPKNAVPNRSRIQGLNARVRGIPRGARIGPAAFDVSPANMNWTQFRGDHGRSIAERDDLAKSWSDEQGVYWKTELPGRGASSPIILYKNLYLTSSSGLGESLEQSGDVDQLTHHVICLDRESGKYNWRRDIKGIPSAAKLTPKLLRHGFATSTPVADGQTVYAFFGASGVFAFSNQGELVWHADVGFQSSEYGSAASLTFYDKLLIVNASMENQTVYALDRQTGKGVWKIDGIDQSWSMPVVGKSSDGQDELIIMDDGFVRGFDPKTGSQLWFCEGVSGLNGSTPFVQDGLCFCNGGSDKKLMAIRLGGRGNVTESHVLWEVPYGSEINSPIYLTGYLFLMSDDGVFQCVDARNGELEFSQTMPTSLQPFASPLLSGNYFYVPLADNGVVVCEANSELKQISHNTFGSESNTINASLSVSEAALFVRNDRHLFRISARNDEGEEISLSSFENESELVIPSRYDVDPQSGKLREYNFYLSSDKKFVEQEILKPFDNLTDEQAGKASKVISENLETFAELRTTQREALWEFLKSGSQDQDGYASKLKTIEQQTINRVSDVREKIKGLTGGE